MTDFQHWRNDQIAGMLAGLTSTIVFHPIDLIKTRLQVDSLRIFDVAQHILREEGATAFYKGLTPNLIGNTLSWGLYFAAYNRIRTRIRAWSGQNYTSAVQDLSAAALSGATIQLITNPIWVVKTRMFLDMSCRKNRAEKGNTARSKAQCLLVTTPITTGNGVDVKQLEVSPYRAMLPAIRHIWCNEGPAGFYRGFLAGLLGVSHGAVQFMAYEQSKKLMIKCRWKRVDNTIHQSQIHSTNNISWSPLETLINSAVSKTVASAVTYPYQVLRSRMQDQRALYKNTWHCIRMTWQHEGITGFYRGLLLNLVKVTPQACTVFVVYESVRKHFNALEI